MSRENLKKFFGKADRKNYHDVAKRVAGTDGLVKGFMGEYGDCSIRAAPAGDSEFVGYLSEHHGELSEYVDHPDRLFCVSFDSLPKGMLGVPERPMIRVYVDVKKEKIVTMDVSNYRQAVV